MPRAVGVVLGLGLVALVVAKARIMMMMPILMTKMMAGMVVMMEMVVMTAVLVLCILFGFAHNTCHSWLNELLGGWFSNEGC